MANKNIYTTAMATANTVSMINDIGLATCTAKTTATCDGAAINCNGTYWLSTKADIVTSDCVNDRLKALEERHKEPKVPIDTKSILTYDGKHIKVTNYKDGKEVSQRKIMPDIKDIIVHNNNVIIVEFVDGTKEKAVLCEEDNFSLDQGISICIAKKLAGGSSIYNKMIDYALRKYKQIQKQHADEAAELKAKKERKRKYAEKKAAKKAAKREEYVKTLQEAFSRALAENKGDE